MYIFMQKSVTSVNANIPLHSTGVVSLAVDNEYWCQIQCHFLVEQPCETKVLVSVSFIPVRS
jgi:hypothetical protein